MSAQRVALVTGENKGIGLAIVENLSTNYPKMRVLLAARDTKLGNEALKKNEIHQCFHDSVGFER